MKNEDRVEEDGRKKICLGYRSHREGTRITMMDRSRGCRRSFLARETREDEAKEVDERDE